MKIFVIGLSHKTAPISIRDKVTINPENLVKILDGFKAHKNITESCVISTCNRTELYGTLDDNPANDMDLNQIFESMFSGLDIKLDEFLFFYTHDEAVKHLFEVSAGLDSMALGEPQIFGQVKDAYQAAAKNKNTSSLINRLFNKTFAVTKRIRTETRIGEGTTSVSFAAVELAQKIFGDLKPLKFLIIGAGDSGTLTARHFKDRGALNMLVANRTFERAENLAAHIQGSAIRFDEITSYLKQIDVVVSSTGADKSTINKDQIKKVMKERKNKPLFLIDLGAPRDIEPEVGSIYNVFLYNIDDLKVIVDANLENRKTEVIAAQRIIDDEVKNFFAWYSTIGIIPTIQKLQERFESIRREEIENNISKMNNSDPEQIDLLTKSIIKKLLKEPILRLKNMAKSSNGQGEAEVLVKLFNLTDNSSNKKET